MEKKKFFYLDNAATSFHKPPQVMDAMVHFMRQVGANPGRSGHALAMNAQEIIENTRENLARLFNIPNADRISFALNITEALNSVIHGFLTPGDHVVTTAMEHNSVMRPLTYLSERGDLSLDIAPCDHKGILDVDRLASLLRKDTRLVVLNHASNVCGTIQDIRAVKSVIGDIPLLLDTAQTAGVVPIDVQLLDVDFLAFTGHKGLMGPQGTGGLYVREGLKLRPLKQGGTGTRSEDLHQPEDMPTLLESGTQNNVGIAGLGAAVAFILREGVDTIQRHEQNLTKALLDGIYGLHKVSIYGPLHPEKQVAVVSIRFDNTLYSDSEGTGGCGSINLEWYDDGVPMTQAGEQFSQMGGILVRTGLHCAPLAHRTLSTYPDGTIRLSMGYFNTLSDIDAVVNVIRQIADV
jgi:cysteine desulfurase / selenocysteine lyase